MPQPYELVIAFDTDDESYITRINNAGTPNAFIYNHDEVSRFALINRALDWCKGDYFMHLENDFYWERKECLDESLLIFSEHKNIDYVRFENLPFGMNTYKKFIDIPDNQAGVMKKDSPYQFTFNPHLRREKFPCGRFQEDEFTKQPEQHHNDNYQGTSACLFGKNFRHLGIYDEGGHYKPWYAERFTLRRGEREIKNALEEFNAFCDNYYYRQLFMRYLHDNRDKHNQKRN
jgi:hypothetical protein